MSHDNAWVTVYEQLVATRNVEVETQWARYNVLAVINTALFAAPAANNELLNRDSLRVWIPIGVLGIAEVLPSVCIGAWFVGLIIVIGRIVTAQGQIGSIPSG
jgi:hypothetical protein